MKKPHFNQRNETKSEHKTEKHRENLERRVYKKENGEVANKTKKHNSLFRGVIMIIITSSKKFLEN